MMIALGAKLELFTRLSDDDKAALSALTSGHVRRFRTRVDIVREGEAPRGVHVLLSGWAGRYRHLNDGRRQTLAVLLPGDLCDHGAFVRRPADHSVGAFTDVTVAEIEFAAFLDEADHAFEVERPRLVAVKEQPLDAAGHGHEVAERHGLADRVDGTDEGPLAAQRVVRPRREPVEAEGDLVEPLERGLFEQAGDPLPVGVDPDVVVAEGARPLD